MFLVTNSRSAHVKLFSAPGDGVRCYLSEYISPGTALDIGARGVFCAQRGVERIVETSGTGEYVTGWIVRLGPYRTFLQG
jgi:hypothetical protein